MLGSWWILLGCGCGWLWIVGADMGCGTGCGRDWWVECRAKRRTMSLSILEPWGTGGLKPMQFNEKYKVWTLSCVPWQIWAESFSFVVGCASVSYVQRVYPEWSVRTYCMCETMWNRKQKQQDADGLQWKNGAAHKRASNHVWIYTTWGWKFSSCLSKFVGAMAKEDTLGWGQSEGIFMNFVFSQRNDSGWFWILESFLKSFWYVMVCNDLWFKVFCILVIFSSYMLICSDISIFLVVSVCMCVCMSVLMWCPAWNVVGEVEFLKG